MPGLSHFAHAIACAFEPAARGAKLPDGSHTASWATSANLKFDTVLGIDGTFMLAINPSPCSDCDCVWYSTATSSGMNYLTTDLSVTGVTGINAGMLPFNSANHTINPNSPTPYNGYGSMPYVRSRIVSASVRLTFSGTTLSDGGVFYTLVEPEHNNLNNATINTILSQYTSCQTQRLSQRGDVELTVWPVTDKSKNFGDSYDDIYGNTQNGIQVWNGSYVYVGLNPPATGGSATNPSTYLPRADMQLQGRHIVNLFWPLSRYSCQSAVYTGPAVSGVTSDANGQINAGTIGGLAAQTAWANGSAVRGLVNGGMLTLAGAQYGGYAVGTTPYAGLYGTFGALSASSGPYNGNLYSIQLQPYALGGIIVNGGTSMAGQSVHVEYVVHVEYTGLGVQGRQTATPSDPHGRAILAAAGFAREIMGQHELGNIGHFIASAARVATGHHGEGVVKLIESIGAMAGHKASAHSILGKRLRLL